MEFESEDKVDRLLKQAYPTQEVSPDFTLRLWRRLMKQPVRPPWMLPAPVYAMAAAIGIVAGIGTWVGFPQSQADFTLRTTLARQDRWDLFGNAPFDSVAGSVLGATEGEAG